MIDWLTWWFGYVYGAVKKVAGESTSVWQPIAADAAEALYAACDDDAQEALNRFAQMKLNDTNHSAYNEYIEAWLDAK